MKRVLEQLMRAAFVLLAVLVSSRSMADDENYYLQIAGVAVTSANAENITGTGIAGTVSYDRATLTLTLDNVTIQGGITEDAGAVRTLLVKGTCQLTEGSSFAPGRKWNNELGYNELVWSDFTIKGDGEGAVLEMNSVNYEALYLQQDCNLTVENCTVNLYSQKNNAIYCSNYDGEKTITVKENSTLTMKSDKTWAFICDRPVTFVLGEGIAINIPSPAYFNSEAVENGDGYSHVTDFFDNADKTVYSKLIEIGPEVWIPSGTFDMEYKGTTFTFTEYGEGEVKAVAASGIGNVLEFPERITRTVVNPKTGETVTKEYIVAAIEGGESHFGGPFRRLSMETLILPSGIRDFGMNTFPECRSLMHVYNYCTDALNTYYNMFSYDQEKFVQGDDYYMAVYNQATLHVPFGSLWAYTHTNCWRMFGTIVEGIEEETFAQAPVFSVGGGEYDEPLTIELSNPNGKGDIYYYLTGESAQSSNYWAYNPEVLKYDGEPIELKSTGVIVAYVTDGQHRSPVARESYVINTNGIVVAGIEVNAANQSDVLGDKGSVSIDPKSGALVLDNATIDCNAFKAETGIEMAGGEQAIILRGNNTIIAPQRGIDFGYRSGFGNGGNLTIIGDGEDEVPTLNIVLDGKGGNGIVCYLANCYIENCNLVINGGTEGIYFKAGGKGDGGLFINNADVRIEAMESAMSGVFDLVLGKDLEILSPEGATFQPAGEKAFENIFADEMVSPSVHIGTPSGVVILPFTREIVIGFPTDDFTTDGKTPVDLYNTVIDNVFYVVDNNNETDNSGYYDTEEQCVVLNQTTTTEQMETVVQNEPGTQEVAESYTGLILQVPAGQGYVVVNTQTTGGSYVAVQVGSDAPTCQQQADRDDVRVDYDVESDTYIYIYASDTDETPTPKPARRQARAKAGKGEAAVKIYSLRVIPEGFRINVSDREYATYFNSQPMRLAAGMKAAVVEGINENELVLNYLYDGDNEECNVIPGGTAVLLSAPEGGHTLTLVDKSTSPAPKMNLLQGSDTDQLTTGGDLYYKLTWSEDFTRFGFFWGAPDGGAFINPAHKAYLAISGKMAQEYKGFELTDDPTGIASSVAQTEEGSTIFNLAGQQMAKGKGGNGQLPRGIYIIGGKKIVIGK